MNDVYITKSDEACIITSYAIRNEGEFFPIYSLVRYTFAGYIPDANKIAKMVNKYVYKEVKALKK